MRIAAFIRENPEAIVAEWENFARTLIPAAGMSPRALRDHIAETLAALAGDIESAQTEVERSDKSHGEKPNVLIDRVAEAHAALREAGGFNIDQMVSEYRSLRASVIKLWTAQQAEMTSQDILDLTRFNESIDESMTVAICYYSRKREHSRDLFLGVLGHDLRNPLGAMLMAVQLIERIGPLNERQTMLIAQTVASAGRVTGLLDNLLDLTRARLGSGLLLIRGPMDMAFVARQLVDEMRILHPSRTFTLKISGNTEGEWDKPRIGQVLSNLLGNAVQYGFTEQPVCVAITGGKNDVVLSVHNDGVPISPRARREIFDPLKRGRSDESTRTSTNLGLGLYITKEIVAAHRGKIGVTSSENNGTTFSAHFPRTTIEAKSKPARTEDQQLEAGQELFRVEPEMLP